MKRQHVKFYAFSVMVLNLISLFVSMFLDTQIISTIVGLVNIVFFILFSVFTYTRHVDSKRKQYQFITNTMHGLRTPITKVKGFSKLIEVETNSEYIEYINKELVELDEMVKQLIKYSIIFENTGLIDKVCVSCILFDEYDRLVKLSTNKKIVTKINEKVEWIINKENLKTLISTLIDNQLKYSEEYLECILNEKELVFINDTKLEDGNYNSLFGRFERKSTTTTGFGIGLSAALEIVTMYGMYISANVVDSKMIVVVSKNKKHIYNK